MKKKWRGRWWQGRFDATQHGRAKQRLHNNTVQYMYSNVNINKNYNDILFGIDDVDPVTHRSPRQCENEKVSNTILTFYRTGSNMKFAWNDHVLQALFIFLVPWKQDRRCH